MALGYVDFTAGQQLTADHMDGIVRQTVPPFASAAARDAALSGVVTEGMLAYLQDAPNRLTYYDGAVWQTVTSDPVVYSPTYTNITVGNGSVFPVWQYSGMHQVFVSFSLTLGSTSVIGTSPQITLPVSPGAAGDISSGLVTLQDVSAGSYVGKLSFLTGVNMEITVMNAGGTFVSLSQVSGTSPFTWATGDVLSFAVTYRV